MSILPDESRHFPNPKCSGCGSFLYANDRAIFYDDTAERPFVLGPCCADRILGALIQDYSAVLTTHSGYWPSHWITKHCAHRMAKVAKGAKVISEEYASAIRGLRYVSKVEEK